MNNDKFTLVTDNLSWATVFAGTVINAKNNPFNRSFQFSIQSTRPEIQVLAACFEKPTGNETQLVVPFTEEEFTELEVIAKQKMDEELYQIHGIVPEDEGVPSKMSFASHASTILWKQAGLISKGSFWYPEVNGTAFDGVSALVTKDYMRDFAQQWLEGYGIKDGDVVYIPDNNLTDQIKCLNSRTLKTVFFEIEDDLALICRSYYKGYDHLGQQPACMAFFDRGFVASRGTVPSWAGCNVAIGPNYDPFQWKGAVRRIQEECKFDHHEFARRRARGEYANVSS